LSHLRDVYAHKALSQVPRLLSHQDRNRYSPTYGCFHRPYWLDKTSDFPDALRQFSVHTLALVYAHDFPGNIYRGQAKIREWAVAGMDFWASLQHADGSFDEFYPYERGWAGPTAFTTYANSEAYRLLADEMPPEVAERVRAAIGRAARFIAAGESEQDHLANHHAVAALAVWKAYELVGDPELEAGFERLWRGFLNYWQPDEGWAIEYDGVDPGYLSATVSFLGKIYQTNPRDDIFDVLRRAVEFASFFVYPNGYYAGSTGSRNTLHFYPHGFEIIAPKVPLAAAVAQRLLQGLADGALVPPEIMSDRYACYRASELLQSYLDCAPRPADLPPLPYQQPSTRYFPGARVFATTRGDFYVVANLAKGGVVKVFDRRDGRLLLNDAGLIGRTPSGQVVTSQWIDPAYTCQADQDGWQVSGHLQAVPSHKVFTPFRHILFRVALITLGRVPAFSHLLKGYIRKTLTLGRRPVPIRFTRSFRLAADGVVLTDRIELEKGARLAALSVGDEFFVRYVPQSRYFQAQELAVEGYMLGHDQLTRLNGQRSLTLRQRLSPDEGWQLDNQDEAGPLGVYDVDYYAGRQRSPQLVYRLRRRTDEVEAALRRYVTGELRCLVDVGTADSLMLDELQRRLGDLTMVGLDLGLALLRCNPNSIAHKVQADALWLPLAPNCADAVVATAIIEHVPDARRMLRECGRVLRADGVAVLTTPAPLMEDIASRLGILKDPDHYETYNLRQLRAMAEAEGLQVLEARKFMFSPVGFPAEEVIERVFGPLGLSLVMANQLLILRK
jgi:SAM-dependent methyltransferase